MPRLCNWPHEFVSFTNWTSNSHSHCISGCFAACHQRYRLRWNLATSARTARPRQLGRPHCPCPPAGGTVDHNKLLLLLLLLLLLGRATKGYEKHPLNRVHALGRIKIRGVMTHTHTQTHTRTHLGLHSCTIALCLEGLQQCMHEFLGVLL